MITVEEIVSGLRARGFRELGGSDVFRILRGRDDSCIKVYYNDYENKDYIIVRESVKGYNE